MNRSTRWLFLGTTLALLSGCADNAHVALNPLTSEPSLADYTVSGETLKTLPAATDKIPVSVYDFTDQTGQHKPNDSMAEYSRAVTQGGAAILTQALLDAGGGNWFTVIERNGLNNLVQERKIIRAMRNNYTTPEGDRLPDIPPLLYAGMLIEGGIVSYESNTLTGGLGARYLGIGGDTEYRRDVVTIYLRAVQVTNGEVILSTNTSKTIYSTALQGSIFKYIGLNELLEIESGFTMNEPPQFATRQAIEMAVYSLIMEGAEKGLWDFADSAAGARVKAHYKKLKEARRQSFENALGLAEMRGLPENRSEAERYAREQEEDGDASLSAQIFSVFGENEREEEETSSAPPPSIPEPAPVAPSAPELPTPPETQPAAPAPMMPPPPPAAPPAPAPAPYTPPPPPPAAMAPRAPSSALPAPAPTRSMYMPPAASQLYNRYAPPPHQQVQPNQLPPSATPLNANRPDLPSNGGYYMPYTNSPAYRQRYEPTQPVRKYLNCGPQGCEPDVR